MKKKDLNQLKKILIQQLRDLLGRSDCSLDELNVADNNISDLLDRASQISEREFSHHLCSREKLHMRRIESSLQDIEEGLIAGTDDTVGEVVGVGVAALAGDRVDRLDIIGAELVEHLVGERHDIRLAHARLQLTGEKVVETPVLAGITLLRLLHIDVVPFDGLFDQQILERFQLDAGNAVHQGGEQVVW